MSDVDEVINEAERDSEPVTDTAAAAVAEQARLERQTDEGEQLLTQHSEIVVTGGPWPEVEGESQTMIINMGPQHPSTHGVLRIMMELDGETVVRAKPIVGYLHTGMEKTGEQLTYVQGCTNVTRMDYASPIANELVFSMAVEQLLDITVPERATWIRMLLAELSRMGSHLLFQASNGMDLGAISMMLFGWREREEVRRVFGVLTEEGKKVLAPAGHAEFAGDDDALFADEEGGPVAMDG